MPALLGRGVKLRGYQSDMVLRIFEAWEQGITRPAVIAPTGSGKTACFSALVVIQESTYRRRPVVLVARDELVRQTVATLKRFAKPHQKIGIIQGPIDESASSHIVVASVQTLSRASRLAKFDPKRFDLIICDEAHWSDSPSWRRILEHFGAFDRTALVCGFTATMTRSGKHKLGEIFDEIVWERDVQWCIQQGFLVPVTAQKVVLPDFDLAKVRTQHGDLSESDLGKALSDAKAGPVIAQAYRDLACDENGELRRGIVFTPTIATAEAFLQDFRNAGIPSELVIGSTPVSERQAVYDATRRGINKVLMSVAVLTTGFDLPAVEVAVMARPTKQRGLYIQCLDAQTEVLTKSGWRGIDDEITSPAAYDPGDGTIHWSELISRAERPLGAEHMYGIQSPTADIRVTAGHRMLWRGRRQPWKTTRADEMAQRLSHYEVAIAGIQDAPGVPLIDDELRFIGWFMTDGTLNCVTNQIVICQSEHQPQNKDIMAMLEGCGFKYAVYRYGGDTQFKANSDRLRYAISKGIPRGTDKHLRGWGALEPWLSKDLAPTLEDVTREQLAVLLEAIHLGDGAKQRNSEWTRRSYHITTANLVFAERLQSLCVRRGFKANLTIGSWNDKPIYVLHVKDTAIKAVGGAGSPDRQSFGWVPSSPNERVWCVEVDTGYIVTRRNGKVAIVGNCVGRALRLSPETGKTDALILDCVGSSALGLASIADLRIHEDPEERDRLIDQSMTGLICKQPAPELPHEVTYAEIDPFSGLRKMTKGKTIEKFKKTYRWSKGGTMFLPDPDGYIALHHQQDGLWTVCEVPTRGSTTCHERDLSLADAMCAAMARHTPQPKRHFSGLATTDQIMYLVRLGEEFDAERLTKAEASERIEIAKASKRLDR